MESNTFDMDQCIFDPFGKENYKRMKALLKKRLSDRRYAHSLGVAKTAKQLAKIYGVDPKVARMAGLLHDWDKRGSDQWVQRRAHTFGVTLYPFIIDHMPWLLHGHTAAVALRREYPELGEDVFCAISRHTTGAPDMSDLDCIVYVADLIEPGRDYGKGSGIGNLRKLAGKVPLQELYYQSYKHTLEYLIGRDKPLFPGTVELYNDLSYQHSQRFNGKSL